VRYWHPSQNFAFNGLYGIAYSTDKSRQAYRAGRVAQPKRRGKSRRSGVLAAASKKLG
jgi:hypothetical protein